MGGGLTTPPLGRLSRLRARLGWLRRNQRGTALVEFALVAPLLFALVIGILDFGQALNYYNQLSQLAGQAARAAAVDCNPSGACAASGTSIQSQISSTYAQGQLRNNMKTCITKAATKVGDPVTVTTSYTFQLVPLLVIKLPSISLQASQTERQEAAPTYSTGCA
jgi:Flp pilus assembly protein TadG